MNGIKYRAYWKSIFGILEHPTEYYYPPELYSGTPYWILLSPWTLFWNTLLNNITPWTLFWDTLLNIITPWTLFWDTLLNIITPWTLFWNTLLNIITPLNSILEHLTVYYYPPELYSETPYWILLPPWTLFWNTLLNIITPLNSILGHLTE